jgi:hypothetical protein
VPALEKEVENMVKHYTRGDLFATVMCCLLLPEGRKKAFDYGREGLRAFDAVVEAAQKAQTAFWVATGEHSPAFAEALKSARQAREEWRRLLEEYALLPASPAWGKHVPQSNSPLEAESYVLWDIPAATPARA